MASAAPSLAPERGPLEFNPYAWDFHEDPFTTYRRLRDEAPAYHHPDLDFWALSRHEDVLAALHDHETFTSTQGITLEARSPLPMIITMDPPEHTIMRRLVSRAFTPRRMAELEPDIRALSTGYLDTMAARLDDGAECDLIEDYAALLPMAVIARMLGVPAADEEMLRHWTDLMLVRDEGQPDLTPAGEEAGAKLFQYFLDHVRAIRAAGAPGDDLTSALVRVESEGRRLDDIEVVAFGFLLIIAGNETTTKLLGNAAWWLTRNPDQRRLLLEDPDLIPDAVEEVLRYEGSTQLQARALTRDLTLHGRTMAAGTKVLLLLGSANRDERAWDDPDRFDITRERTTQHLAFGHGIHVCLGAALARLEMRVSLEEIHRRFPDYAIDHDRCVRVHAGNVRGYAHMPFTA
jgi:cytochrome P450